MKVCSKCNANKDKGEFNKCSNCPDGLQRWCRSCQKKAKRKFDKLNEQHVREYTKKYRLKHKEKFRKYQKTYQESYYGQNKEILLAYQKEYYRMNKDRIINRVTSWWFNNLDKARELHNLNTRKYREMLSDHYVKDILRKVGYTKDEIEAIPVVMIIKRIQILNNRINKPKNKNNEKRKEVSK